MTAQQSLCIPRIECELSNPMEEISSRVALSGAEARLDEAPWPEFPYKPEVTVHIGHSGAAIFLRFDVHEQAALAEKTESNSQVSEDSCVEMFIAPGGDGRYYNFEWSCIGTCLAGVGAQRHGRRLLDPELIRRIRRSSTLGNEAFAERKGPTAWSLTVALPVETFVFHEVGELSGSVMTGNFYKCGDHLSVPHYVTWHSIESARPDYHRPEQFGRIEFA